ncbi:MAG: hypothetical protein ACM34M_14565, partial [Ignavibacteria bacterium]
PFNVEVKIFCYFFEYKYEIFFSIAEDKELNRLNINKYFINLEENPLINNYYHVFLEKDEIKKAAMLIGDNLFYYIKSEHESKNHNWIKLPDKELENLWGSFINDNIHDEGIRKILSNKNPKLSNGKFVTFTSVHQNYINLFSGEMSKFIINYIIKKNNVKRGVGYIINP